MKKLTQGEEIGTSLQGYIVASYERIKEVFGESIHSCDKTRYNVAYTLDDSTFTIYDWKENCELKEVRLWHIGGYTDLAVERVKSLKKFDVVHSLRQIREKGIKNPYELLKLY